MSKVISLRALIQPSIYQLCRDLDEHTDLTESAQARIAIGISELVQNELVLAGYEVIEDYCVRHTQPATDGPA